MDPTQETLKEFCSYCPETGQFLRIKAMDWRQQRNVGRPCGSINKATGYVEFNVAGKLRYAHRMAWIYAHGSIPEGAKIDHWNLDRSDNRLTNLRIATHADNLRNCRMRSNNTSGVKGVWFDRSRGQWAVMVGKQKLGRFDTLLDAACARKSAALVAFGAFAREGG